MPSKKNELDSILEETQAMVEDNSPEKKRYGKELKTVRRIKEEEKYGLNEIEIQIAQKQLAYNGVGRSLLSEKEAAKCFEMFILGYNFIEISEQIGVEYPKLIFTASYNKWCKRREDNVEQFKDRIKIKMAKTIVDQVDYISMLFEVNNLENMKAMKGYLKDPDNSPLPNMRITSFKDYKDLIEMINKMYTSAANMTSKTADMLKDLDFKSSTGKALKNTAIDLEDGTEQEIEEEENPEDDMSAMIASELAEGK